MKIKRLPDFEGDNNRGFTIHKLEAYAPNEPDHVGYIMIELIPRDRFDSWYESIEGFLNHIKGMGTHRDIPRYRMEDLEVQFKEFEEYHVDFPFVSYIRVREGYLRRGIGTLLYLEGGKWMKEMGMKLHSSTLQCNDIPGKAWLKMASKGQAAPLPRRKVDTGNRYYIL